MGSNLRSGPNNPQEQLSKGVGVPITEDGPDSGPNNPQEQLEAEIGIPGADNPVRRAAATADSSSES